MHSMYLFIYLLFRFITIFFFSFKIFSFRFIRWINDRKTYYFHFFKFFVYYFFINLLLFLKYVFSFTFLGYNKIKWELKFLSPFEVWFVGKPWVFLFSNHSSSLVNTYNFFIFFCCRYANVVNQVLSWGSLEIYDSQVYYKNKWFLLVSRRLKE